MSLHFSSRLKIASVWAAIGLLGAGVGWLNYRAESAAMLKHMLGHARLSAVAIEAAEAARLRGVREDLGTPAYLALKERLRRLKAVDSRVRFVYVFRSLPEKKTVIFLGDSAEPGAKDESLPGDNYPQAAESPGLQEILRTGQSASEGPLSDDFGTWMTAYAPLGSWTKADPVAVRHILGVDIDAADWRMALWWAGVEAAVLVWFGLGLPVGGWLMVRRQREQNEVIRNLSEAMEQSHSAIMIIDQKGRIEYANRGLGRQTGFSRRELFGRSWRELHSLDDPIPMVGEIDACMRAGQEWEGEWLSSRKDGSTFPVRGGVTPVKHRDGTIACFVAVFDDVTESRRREAELREATEQARAGDKAKGQFLATMSHEVRTPLNGIVGFTNLLLDTTLTSEQREYVQTVRMSAEALIQLTGDILDFARIESGKLKLEAAPCDPREGVEDALDLLATKAADKGIELLHDISPEVPSLIHVDGGRLRQVLINLIGNAVKFTERGEITVTVKVGGLEDVPAPADGIHAPKEAESILVFAVRDTGIGIAPEHHSKLFRAFSQVDDSMTRRYGGTGLGLAVSRNLVELMGGRISVRSTPREGSTFTFSIRVPVAGPRPRLRDLGGCRILLVGPAGAFRREIRDLLQHRNGQVVEAEKIAALAGTEWDTALVEVTAELGNELAAQTEVAAGWVPERTFGIVPISASNQLRAAMRRHFRLLVNKPVHHEALCSLLGGTPAARPAKPVSSSSRFGLRVLVVEDNPVNQRVIKRVLENLGCTTALAENGQEALDVLSARAKEFDLVLLDLHMPVMDGITAVTAIRGGKAGPDAKALAVVALTADARDDQRQRGMEAGLDGYLTKPLNVPDLTAVLSRVAAKVNRS